MNWFKTIYYIALIGLLISGSMVLKNKFLLKTEHAPMGMLSLQLATSTDQHQRILHEWDSVYINQQIYSRDTVITGKITALDTAYQQTRADDQFAIFYIAFLTLLFYRYRETLKAAAGAVNTKPWLWLVLMVLAAGILDLVENSKILNIIKNHKNLTPGKAMTIFLPALLKFVLLITALLYFFVKVDGLTKLRTWLQRISSLLLSFVIYGWKFRIVLIALLVLFLALSVTNQGQDLLVTINTSDRGIFWFFTVTTILALLNWHLPKIYDNLDQLNLRKIATTSLQFSKDKREKLDFARLLGLLTFLIPGTAVLLTMQAYHISYPLMEIPPLLLFAILCILYINALRYNWLDRIYKPKGQFSLQRYLITILLILALILLWGRSATTSAPYYPIYLALGFFLLSFAFVVAVSYRTCIKGLESIAVAPFILSAGIILCLLFVAFNIEPIVFVLTKYDRFYTLPVVIAGLATYIIIFSFLLMLGRKTGIQIITLLLLFVIYKSATSINDIHKVHLVTRAATTASQQSLRTYVHRWLESRKAEISDHNNKYADKPFPVFFVNAYGGGIKAAAWTTMVVGRLDQLLKVKSDNQRDFQHYVFSYSGVSGGAVGASLLCAARLQGEQEKTATLFYPGHVRRLFQHDYLTATLAALLGRDAFLSLTGFKLYPDRARLQEKNWEIYMRQYGLNYDRPLIAGYSNSETNTPLLFANTYDINTGFKGILAPLSLLQKDFPGSILVRDLMNEDEDLYLSTTALISARFPYVSPTAKFDEQHHFTDGGTLENSGAETSLQVYTVFQSVLDSLRAKDASYAALKLKFNFLSLPNSVPEMDSVQRIKNIYEPLAPALGILNSTNGNTIKADTINRFLAKKNNWNYFSINPTVKKITENVWPVLPLGWQISDYALQQMELNITDPNSSLYEVLKVFPVN